MPDSLTRQETFEVRCERIKALWEEGFRLNAIATICNEKEEYITGLASKRKFRRPEGYSARLNGKTVADYVPVNVAVAPPASPEYVVTGMYCRPCQRRVLKSEALMCSRDCATKRMCQ